MTIKELPGSYAIEGSNQEQSDLVTYTGTLHLSLDSANRILAHWQISEDQEQHGSGFFKDNILVINFYYLGDNNLKYKGVAVYRCITKDILEGFWSEKLGNPLYLGSERCLRLHSTDFKN
ncbi:hypothetical protein FFWV33_14250 [Flavobacterium faecale]|uniref:Uncharacterized protein n=1 Tax=Flavobacterium faecale TaxID=1355330 RepID=A0A2S1LFS1_9FLAO|nr:hypothetical protein [Flavobacterium faecale]AWG22605.1 hypothetical protein FFWV33_14250 [Flavobacterium faecale]